MAYFHRREGRHRERNLIPIFSLIFFTWPLAYAEAPRVMPQTTTSESSESRQEQFRKVFDEVRQKWLIKPVEIQGDEMEIKKSVDKFIKKSTENVARSWVFPGTAFYAPGGSGLNWTEVLAGVGLQLAPRRPRKPDGVWVVGMGFGNAAKYAGLEVTYADLDVDNPFSAGGFNFKLHRKLTDDWSVAIAWMNLLILNAPSEGSSLYFATSKRFNLREDLTKPFSSVTLAAGIGNGSFRLERDIEARREAISGFAAVGLRMFQPLGLVLDWTSSDLTGGLSVSPFRRFPLVASAGVIGLTRIQEGVGFIFTVGYADSVTSDTFPIGLFRK